MIDKVSIDILMSSIAVNSYIDDLICPNCGKKGFVNHHGMSERISDEIRIMEYQCSVLTLLSHAVVENGCGSTFKLKWKNGPTYWKPEFVREE
jgi:hypothetical protein